MRIPPYSDIRDTVALYECLKAQGIDPTDIHEVISERQYDGVSLIAVRKDGSTVELKVQHNVYAESPNLSDHAEAYRQATRQERR